jgi:hypothetical protein
MRLRAGRINVHFAASTSVGSGPASYGGEERRRREHFFHKVWKAIVPSGRFMLTLQTMKLCPSSSRTTVHTPPSKPTGSPSRESSCVKTLRRSCRPRAALV